jgi:hypothetical protein
MTSSSIVITRRSSKDRRSDPVIRLWFAASKLKLFLAMTRWVAAPKLKLFLAMTNLPHLDYGNYKEYYN